MKKTFVLLALVSSFNAQSYTGDFHLVCVSDDRSSSTSYVVVGNNVKINTTIIQDTGDVFSNESYDRIDKREDTEDGRTTLSYKDIEGDHAFYAKTSLSSEGYKTDFVIITKGVLDVIANSDRTGTCLLK